MKEEDGRFAAKLADARLSGSEISGHIQDETWRKAYRPPERGHEELTGAEDVFAFGGVLVYLFGDDHVHPLHDLDDKALTWKIMVL